MKKILITACFLGAIGIVLGAFGAHGLADVLAEKQLSSYKTGVTYQMYHVLAILLVGSLSTRLSLKTMKIASICFLVGILLFSGSIYLLSTREVTGLTSYKWLGPITPIGGLFFIVGWISLGIGMIKMEHKG